jgi:DNA-3-methyladenine glycosylase
MFSNPLSPVELRSTPVIAREFYQRPTEAVARDLLGKLLVSESPEGITVLRLNEVEAYLGVGDPACHSSGGRRSARIASMWGDAGHAYVYLIYGLHHCFNLVTVGGVGEAVLVRGGEPVMGLDLIRERRGPGVPDRELMNGPGKLCQALGIGRELDGLDVCDRRSAIWLGDDGIEVAEADYARTPRIGVASAGEAAGWPLRFSVVSPGAP